MKVLILALNSRYIHTMLAARCLKAAAAAFEPEVSEQNVNLPLTDLLAEVYRRRPDVLAVPTYIFNVACVRALLPEVRKILPACKILMGGPEAGGDPASFFSLADCILTGEGEQIFPAALEKIREGEPLPRIWEGEEIPDLDRLPDPYDPEYLAMGKDRILYFESSRGCPFSCAYCMSGRSRLRNFSLDRVFQALQRVLSARPRLVKFTDRTFNADLPRAKRILAFLLERAGETEFHFEMAPELFDEELFDLLAAAPKGLFRVEIGIQSFRRETLTICHRPMREKTVMENLKRLCEMENLTVHADLIAGLPGEGLDSFRTGFDRLAACRPDELQLGFLKVLKGSALSERAEELGLVFSDQPPYEILQTSALSFGELLRLKDAERGADAFFAKGRYRETLNFLCGPLSAFELCEALGRGMNRPLSAAGKADLLFLTALDLLRARTDIPALLAEEEGSAGSLFYGSDSPGRDQTATGGDDAWEELRKKLAERIGKDFAREGNVRAWRPHRGKP